MECQNSKFSKLNLLQKNKSKILIKKKSLMSYKTKITELDLNLPTF